MSAVLNRGFGNKELGVLTSELRPIRRGMNLFAALVGVID